MSKEVNKEAPAKKKLGKSLSMTSPFVKTFVGMYVHGVIEVFGNSTSKLGTQETATIKLLSPCSWEGKDKKTVTKHPGEAVRVVIKPGLQAITSLDLGTEVTIECAGTVDTGKGNPAYTYEVSFA